MNNASENGKTTYMNLFSFGKRPGDAKRNASYTKRGNPTAIATKKQTVSLTLISSKGSYTVSRALDGTTCLSTMSTSLLENGKVTAMIDTVTTSTMTTRSRSSLRCSDRGLSISFGGSVVSCMLKGRWRGTIKSFVSGKA